MSAADTFEGTLCDNVPHGYGSYSWADGSLYEGDWCEGVRTGRGTYTWPSSARYEGEFLAGRMHGQGVFTAPDGTRYEGSWQNDLKHGLGASFLSLVEPTAWGADCLSEHACRHKVLPQRRPVPGSLARGPAARAGAVQGVCRAVAQVAQRLPLTACPHCAFFSGPIPTSTTGSGRRAR